MQQQTVLSKKYLTTQCAWEDVWLVPKAAWTNMLAHTKVSIIYIRTSKQPWSHIGHGAALYVITERLEADSTIYSLAEINKLMVIDLMRGVWAVVWALIKLPVVLKASVQLDKTQRGTVVLLITAVWLFWEQTVDASFPKIHKNLKSVLIGHASPHR